MPDPAVSGSEFKKQLRAGQPKMGLFLNAAREFDADAGYLKSMSFRKLLPKLEHEIYLDYQFTAQATDPNFDPDKFGKDFAARRRGDGKKY